MCHEFKQKMTEEQKKKHSKSCPLQMVETPSAV